MEDHSMWKTLIPILNNKYKILVIDLPGHGKSSDLDTIDTIENIAEILFLVLSTERINKTVLVGHSLGGYVALEMAKIEPDKITAIVLLHSTAMADSDIKKKERDRVIKVLEMNAGVFIREAIPNLFAESTRDKFKKEIDDLTKLALENNSRGLISTTRAMRDRDNKLNWIKNNSIPVHFIIGAKDPIIPMEMYTSQIFIHKNVSHYIAENAGHMGLIESPEEISKNIYEFIEQYI
jgi:pimeloyl-ACP methyl ester carboxylesterase